MFLSLSHKLSTGKSEKDRNSATPQNYSQGRERHSSGAGRASNPDSPCKASVIGAQVANTVTRECVSIAVPGSRASVSVSSPSSRGSPGSPKSCVLQSLLPSKGVDHAKAIDMWTKVRSALKSKTTMRILRLKATAEPYLTRQFPSLDEMGATGTSDHSKKVKQTIEQLTVDSAALSVILQTVKAFCHPQGSKPVAGARDINQRDYILTQAGLSQCELSAKDTEMCLGLHIDLEKKMTANDMLALDLRMHEVDTRISRSGMSDSQPNKQGARDVSHSDKIAMPQCLMADVISANVSRIEGVQSRVSRLIDGLEKSKATVEQVTLVDFANSEARLVSSTTCRKGIESLAARMRAMDESIDLAKIAINGARAVVAPLGAEVQKVNAALNERVNQLKVSTQALQSSLKEQKDEVVAMSKTAEVVSCESLASDISELVESQAVDLSLAKNLLARIQSMVAAAS